MPLFETPRLIARPLSRDDLPALTAILSDPQVMEYSLRGVCDEQATLQFIEWCLQCYTELGIGPWALVEKGSGELVGFCGVSPEQVGEVQEANLGYRLATRFWNRGLASEAARGVLQWVFLPASIGLGGGHHRAGPRCVLAGGRESRVQRVPVTEVA